MTKTLLIGIPLHSNPKITIKNIELFREFKSILIDLNIRIDVCVSCDSDILGIQEIFKKYTTSRIQNIKVSMSQKQSTSMVDNWSNALKKFKNYDFCYLLHDDDLINGGDFFGKILPLLIQKQPDILAFNSYLDNGIDQKHLQQNINDFIYYNSNDYICNKSTLPAPSQTIFRPPEDYHNTIYSDLLCWCPETKLYLDIMKKPESRFIFHSSPGVIRGISKNQVSYGTTFKGAADLAVLGGFKDYFNSVSQYFSDMKNFTELDKYFGTIFFDNVVYQKDNLHYILKFVSKNHFARYSFLKNLSLFSILELKKDIKSELLISRVHTIISNANSYFFREKIVRIIELCLMQLNKTSKTRMAYDYEILKRIDSEYLDAKYSKNYISDRIVAMHNYSK